MWKVHNNQDIEPTFISLCDILSDGETAISRVLNIGSREPLL
jgi:hypothetical protein